MEQADIRRIVDEVFATLMEERGAPLADPVDPGRGLYDGGYGLDSMDTATLSAMLGERLEDDPYAAGVFPQTVGEIVAYYTAKHQPVAA